MEQRQARALLLLLILLSHRSKSERSV